MTGSVRTARLGAVVVVVLVAIGLSVWWQWQGQPASVDAEPAAFVEPSPPEPAQTPAALSVEERAKADLERLVREYYAAENEVFLDPSRDPMAALEPYLRNPAHAARLADILRFRNAGHQLEASSVEVHWVEVVGLELGSESGTAMVEECSSISMQGIDVTSGQPRESVQRGVTVWTALSMEDGTWRLSEYTNEADGSPRC